MQSRTSWFNWALFKKNCTRFWPIWVGYALLWTFILPLQLFNQTRFAATDYAYFSNIGVLTSIEISPYTVIAASILAAMAVFSYLYNNRSTGMIHALPVRREELFFTNYVSGLAFLAVPAVLVFLLTLGAEAIFGVVNVGALCMWLVVHLLVILFFYSFSVFCAMFTGNIVALPTFFGILNFLPIAVFGMLDALLQQFLYGYASIGWMSEAARWLTPFMQISQDFRVSQGFAQDGHTVLSAQFFGLGTALIYAGVGLLLAVAALLIYRRRALETAGDVVSVSWVRPIFKYGVGVCAALAGGVGLYSIFGTHLMSDPMWSVLIWLLPSGVVGYFGAQMLLDKSFRVFSSWKGCLVLLAGLCLGMGLLYCDPMGFTRWVPAPQEVTSLALRTWDVYPYDENSSKATYTDPEALALAVQFHQDLIAQRNQVTAYRIQERGALETNVTRNRVSLCYTLVDGRTIYRAFEYLVDEAILEEPTSAAALLTTLLNLPGQEQRYAFPTSDKMRLVAIDLPVFNRDPWNESSVSVPSAGLEEVYAAILSDLAAGRLGRRYLTDTDEQLNTCYYSDLTLSFYSPEGGATLHPDIPMAQLQEQGWLNEKDWRVLLTLQSTATDTLAALRRLGVLNERQTLVTQMELNAQREQMEYEQGSKD